MELRPENLTTLLLFAAVFLFLYKLFQRPHDTKCRPPCPKFRLPVLGHIPILIMNSDLLTLFRRLRGEHGDIFRLEIGSTSLVVMNGYDVLERAFVKRGDTFAGRPTTFFTRICKSQGLLGSTGITWKEQRRFAIRGLREFGFGRSKMEINVLTEVQNCLEQMKSMEHISFNPKMLLQRSVANVIGGLLYGGSLDVHSDRFKEFMKLNDENVRLSGVSSVLNFFPALQYLPFDLFKVKQLTKNYKTMILLIRQIIDEHRHTMCDGHDPRDFLDLYIRETEKEKNNPNSTFGDEQAVFVTGDMLIAGIETTVTTLRWAFVYLILYPDIQARIQNEIDDAIPHTRLPKMSDKPALQYTSAFIMELLRHTDAAPLGLQHAVTEDINFDGFFISKTDVLVPNIDSVLNDNTSWMQPRRFNPERFLDDHGKLRYHHAFIPFFFGKRMCPGEHLAKMTLTLFLAAILQHFTITSPDAGQINVKGILGITFSPQDFNVSVKLRHKYKKMET